MITILFIPETPGTNSVTVQKHFVALFIVFVLEEETTRSSKCSLFFFLNAHYLIIFTHLELWRPRAVKKHGTNTWLHAHISLNNDY